jgi:hypothetical protein
VTAAAAASVVNGAPKICGAHTPSTPAASHAWTSGTNSLAGNTGSSAHMGVPAINLPAQS